MTRLPLLRGRILRSERYQSVRGGPFDKPLYPDRDPRKHQAHLSAQLDAIKREIDSRPPATRVPGAERELVAVRPESGFAIDAERLADKKADVRLVGVDEKTGTVLIDTPDPGLGHLRERIDRFADPARNNKDTGRPAYTGAIAPIDTVELAKVADRAADRTALSGLDQRAAHWFELACPGGRREPADVTARSRTVIGAALSRLGIGQPLEYLATMRIVFLARLTLGQLAALFDMVGAGIYDFDVSSTAVRDWLLQKSVTHPRIQKVSIAPPPPGAPRVALLDTGIATGHPLLAPVLRDAYSVVPGENSGEDATGHGTEMAGIAAFGDVGGVVDAGQIQAPHWLESVRIMIDEAHWLARPENRPLWPRTAENSIQLLEMLDGGRRVFATAITGDLGEVRATHWSHAFDNLAYNNGKGRLILVSAGNVPVHEYGAMAGYPQSLLTYKIADPAQAVNVLTVGAYTERASLPGDGSYAAYSTVAPSGGASPFSRTGVAAWDDGIKPEVVFEGGNVATDGSLPDATVPTLAGLTTGHDFQKEPLSTIQATSEATARAAHFVARLVAQAPDLSEQSIRALVVHSARWTQVMEEQVAGKDDRLAMFGYGVPDLERAHACANERATVIVEDSIANAVVRYVTVSTSDGKSRTERRVERYAKVFRMPLPEDLLMAAGADEVELRITLSYFAEPSTFRRKLSRGLDLRWDMQGPREKELDFQRRINKVARGGKKMKSETEPFPWELGFRRRSRGTVQSDWWRGSAVDLAGSKLLAVYPVLGWWDQRDDTNELEMPFSLVVTVTAPGLDIYVPIQVELAQTIPVPI